jgi:hypothetical protein
MPPSHTRVTFPLDPTKGNTAIAFTTQRKTFIKSSTFLLWGFVTAFFPRIFNTLLKFPSAINFLHFLIVPFAGLVAIFNTKTKDKQQIAISQALLIGLVALFTINVASAVLNKAGFINIILEFLLLGEPLIMLLGITSLAMSPKNIERFQKWLVISAFSNLILVYIQRYVLRYDLLRPISPWDLMQGVFYFTGAGHVVSASVSLTFAFYYFTTVKPRPLWLRIAVVFAALGQIIISDTKQIFLVFLIAAVIFVLLKMTDIVKAIQYILLFIIGGSALYWAAFNLAPNTELKYWTNNLDLVQDGLELKYSVFSIVHSYYHSTWNWLLGLGPGHTVGRLGGWMVRDYYDLLHPLGVTVHPLNKRIWEVVSANPLGDKSSLWSPLWGWAGIWGDLGFLGLGTYLYISFLAWRYFCVDDFSRYALLSVWVFGAVFSQMEEPGYMLFVMSLIGIRWHEHRCRELS